MSSNIKCTLKENGFIDFCTGMDRCLEPQANTKSKGLVQLNLYNFKTGKERCLGVVYQKSRKDRGLMLNLCPWCGENILFEKEVIGK